MGGRLHVCVVCVCVCVCVCAGLLTGGVYQRGGGVHTGHKNTSRTSDPITAGRLTTRVNAHANKREAQNSTHLSRVGRALPRRIVLRAVSSTRLRCHANRELHAPMRFARRLCFYAVRRQLQISDARDFMDLRGNYEY